MRRCHGTRLLLIAFLIGSAVLLPFAKADAETLSQEEIAEEAVLKEAAGEIDPDAPEVAEEQTEETVDEKDVLVLTEDTFDDALKNNQNILVEFYAPWCGHCQSLKPEYAKAATALKAAGIPVALAKVDATEQPNLGQKYAVEGYPTLKWFVGGDILEYTGGRTEDAIVGWVKKKTGPPALDLKTEKELNALKKGGSFAVGYFSKLGDEAHKAFEDAARASDKVEFFQTTDAAVAKAAGLAKEGLILARSFEGEVEFIPFSGTLERDAIKAFIKSNRVPPYVEFTEENQDVIFQSGIPLNIITIVGKDDIKKGSAVTKAMVAAHATTAGKVIFVLCDKDSEAADPIGDFFGLTRSDKPQVVAFNMDSSHKYYFGQDFEEKAFVKFAEGVVSGAIQPDYKSADIPTGEDAKDGDVVVVVGKNFDDIVLDEKKDVLVEAYAPWCGHCKSLAPVYRKLAKRFVGVDSVVIAKFEATSNEHQLVKVEGFPSIMLFPAGKDQKPVVYSGDRSLKDMTQFLKKEAKVSFTLPKLTKEQEEAEEKAAEEEAKAAAEAEEASSEEDAQEIEIGEDDLELGDVAEGDEDSADAEEEADEVEADSVNDEL